MRARAPRKSRRQRPVHLGHAPRGALDCLSQFTTLREIQAQFSRLYVISQRMCFQKLEASQVPPYGRIDITSENTYETQPPFLIAIFKYSAHIQMSSNLVHSVGHAYKTQCDFCIACLLTRSAGNFSERECDVHNCTLQLDRLLVAL